MTRPDLGTGEPGRHPNPRTRRGREGLAYFLLGVGGLVLLWAAGRDDSSDTLSTVGRALVLAGGWLAWCGFRRVGEREPPLELGLVRDPANDDPSK